MPGPETPESLFTQKQPIDSFEFTSDGQTYSVPREGSVIRRFNLGDGGLDYLICKSSNGRLVFMPEPEESVDFFDYLSEAGFAVESLPEPDDEALKLIIELGLVDITPDKLEG